MVLKHAGRYNSHMSRILLAGFLCVLSAFAQYDTASVLGTVTDPSAAVVAGVKVTLENVRTGVKQSAVTDTDGNYAFLSQRIGEYRVTAEAQGFKQVSSGTVHSDRQCPAAREPHTRRSATSRRASPSPAAAEALETDSSDRGQVIQRDAIVNLPLNGRAYADLALLSPGVRKSNITNRDASFNVNGLRSSLEQLHGGWRR